jgi:putative spermidine/putrescine transport system substrate-binding protein
MKLLATAPGNSDGAVFSNADWWLKNGETAQRAFDDMMSR